MLLAEELLPTKSQQGFRVALSVARHDAIDSIEMAIAPVPPAVKLS